jgi:hypothetical protein
MRIGVDLDNTIVCYDDVFYQAAQLQNLLPIFVGKTKGEIRDYLRSIGQEDRWTELQGFVYGARMDLARPFPGVENFFQSSSHLLCIISHRTRIPYKGPAYDLHASAQTWLQQYTTFRSIPVFFELSLARKLARIEEIKCDLFIDDLPELLSEPSFPPGVEKILFDPNNLFPSSKAYHKLSSWQEIVDFVGAMHASR